MAASPIKARVIYVHRNGEAPHTGDKASERDKSMRMVLHPTKMRDFEQLKGEMTAKVRLVTGAVRKVYNRADGSEVTDLDQFVHEGHYVCCGGEKLKAESLSVGASPKKSSLAPASGTSTPSRAPLQSQNTPEKGKNTTFFRNGDRHYTGAKFVIHSKKYKLFDQLLTDLSLKVGVSTGAVRKIVTPTGELIDSLEAIEENGKYICCGGERFDPDNLPKALTGESPSPAKGTPKRLPGTPGTPSGVSPASRPSPKPKIEKFGTQTEKGKVIWGFQNGDKHHHGVKFVIHSKKYKTIDQVKVQMSSQLTLPTGPVQKIYAFRSLSDKPVEIKDIADFEDGGNYLICGPEKINRDALPSALVELASKRDKLENGHHSEDSSSTSTSTSTSTSILTPTPTPTPVVRTPEPEPEPEPEPVPVPQVVPVPEPEPEPEPELVPVPHAEVEVDDIPTPDTNDENPGDDDTF